MGRRSERQHQILHVMGIRAWQERTAEDVPAAAASADAPGSPPPHVATAPPAQPVPSKPVPPQPRVTAHAQAPDAAALDWPALSASVAACTLCALCETRTRTVFGCGNRSADWMFIGEAPGAEEDRRGEPFVGRAGRLLDAMMRAIALERGDAYIANVLKCRPPGNRDPQTDEVQMCSAYLDRQIALVNPRLIVAVGRIAAQRLLGTGDSLARLRGKVHHYGPMQTPLIVTYHPAYLLRSPAQKRKAWEDLLLGVRSMAGAPA